MDGLAPSPAAGGGTTAKLCSVVLQRVSFSELLTFDPILKDLEIVDCREEPPAPALGLPFGLVGMRLTQDVRNQQVEEAFLKIMDGRLKPQAGSALCLLRSRFVGLKPLFADGTIVSNVSSGALSLIGGERVCVHNVRAFCVCVCVCVVCALQCARACVCVCLQRVGARACARARAFVCIHVCL